MPTVHVPICAPLNQMEVVVCVLLVCSLMPQDQIFVQVMNWLHSQNRASCIKSVDVLQQICYQQADIRCVRMACDSLLTARLLQVVNRLVTS